MNMKERLTDSMGSLFGEPVTPDFFRRLPGVLVTIIFKWLVALTVLSIAYFYLVFWVLAIFDLKQIWLLYVVLWPLDMGWVKGGSLLVAGILTAHIALLQLRRSLHNIRLRMIAKGSWKVWRLRIIVVIVIFLFTGIAVVLGRAMLNYSGFCFSEFRYLSDEEKIASAVAKLLAAHAEGNSEYIDAGDGLDQTLIIPKLPYSSVEEFRASNPDCCRIIRYTGFQPQEEYKFGSVWLNAVHIIYHHPLPSAGGRVDKIKIERIYVIESCGRAKWARPS